MEAEEDDVANATEEEAFDVGMRQNAADYQAHDINHDGKLDFAEFCALVRERESHAFSKSELAERFAALDEDKSGLIELHEYVRFSLTNALARSASRVLDLFRSWDTDGSGSIDRAEFRRAIRQLGFNFFAEDAEIDMVFDEFDKDGSGEIDYKELNRSLRRSVSTLDKQLQPGALGVIETEAKTMYALRRREPGQKLKSRTGAGMMSNKFRRASVVAAPARMHEELRSLLTDHKKRVVDLFREWDEDSNGLVTRAEFLQAMYSLGVPAGHDRELSRLFDTFDTDGDGTLDYDELNRALRRGASVEVQAQVQSLQHDADLRGGDNHLSPNSTLKGERGDGGAAAKRKLTVYRTMYDSTNPPRASGRPLGHLPKFDKPFFPSTRRHEWSKEELREAEELVRRYGAVQQLEHERADRAATHKPLLHSATVASHPFTKGAPPRARASSFARVTREAVLELPEASAVDAETRALLVDAEERLRHYLDKLDALAASKLPAALVRAEALKAHFEGLAVVQLHLALAARPTLAHARELQRIVLNRALAAAPPAPFGTLATAETLLALGVLHLQHEPSDPSRAARYLRKAADKAAAEPRAALVGVKARLNLCVAIQRDTSLPKKHMLREAQAALAMLEALPAGAVDEAERATLEGIARYNLMCCCEANHEHVLAMEHAKAAQEAVGRSTRPADRALTSKTEAAQRAYRRTHQNTKALHTKLHSTSTESLTASSWAKTRLGMDTTALTAPSPSPKPRAPKPKKTPKEQLKQLLAGSLTKMADLFREWDEDGSGTIDKFEFSRAVASLDPRVSAEAVWAEACDAVFDDYDFDGSGEIDYSEYVRFSLREALAKSLTRVIDLFKKWDEDDDGAVSKKEFRRAIKTIGFDAPREEVDRVFDSIDEDGSGTIEYTELNQLLRQGANTKLDAKLMPGQGDWAVGVGMVPKPAPSPPPAARGPAKGLEKQRVESTPLLPTRGGATAGGTLKELQIPKSQSSATLVDRKQKPQKLQQPQGGGSGGGGGGLLPRLKPPLLSSPSKLHMMGLVAQLGARHDLVRANAKADRERFAAKLRFVPFTAFEACGHIPRFGSNKEFVHPLSKVRNENLCQPLDKFDRSRTAFIFVSHRWITPHPGATGHPDDVERHSKYALVCEAVRRLQAGPSSPIPEHFKVALWVDYSCVDQDDSPAAELEERMATLVGLCDLLLTPVVDPDHKNWALPLTFENAIEDCQASAWKEYWKRAWCRVEAFLAAVVPVEASAERAQLFRGGMNLALSAGRRPHVIFGTKEYEEGRPPLFLPPMINATFHKYAPASGNLTSENDRAVISGLTETARVHVEDTEAGYSGQRNNAGVPHGSGRMVFDDGGVYDGDWVDGKEEGQGTYLWTWGDKYTGGWSGGKKHGEAVHTYADGGKYVGPMVDDVREGWGRFRYGHGDEFEGQYANDLKKFGMWFFKSGEVRVCRWELHETNARSSRGHQGQYSVIKGDGAKWSADRKTAWRLLDGEVVAECTPEEAAAISTSILGEGEHAATPQAYMPGRHWPSPMELLHASEIPGHRRSIMRVDKLVQAIKQ